MKVYTTKNYLYKLQNNWIKYILIKYRLVKCLDTYQLHQDFESSINKESISTNRYMSSDDKSVKYKAS